MHSIRMYWPNFWLPRVHKQQSIFKKSYRNLQLKPSRFFWHLLCPNWSIIRGAASLWTFARIRNQWHFPWKTTICPSSNILQRLTVLRIIDRFRCKRCQSKREDMDYKLIYDFFKDILLFTICGQSDIRSVHTYVMPRMVYF